MAEQATIRGRVFLGKRGLPVFSMASDAQLISFFFTGNLMENTVGIVKGQTSGGLFWSQIEKNKKRQADQHEGRIDK